jgi:hypothetical protein
MNVEEIKELRTEIEGRGEVKGFKFELVNESSFSYLYEKRSLASNRVTYEVFKRKVNKQYNCISYPSSKAFGVWAWEYKAYSDAYDKFQELDEKGLLALVNKL